jgi:hypothetical protein
MRLARFAAPAALLLLAIVILMLNLREKDYYELGSLVPPRGDTVPGEDGTFRRIVPATIAHPCPTCGDCTHAVEILQNRRVFSIRDHDGWYKLFWAGDETYYYDDPPVFAASLRNSTARDPRGTWTIRGRLGPPTHGVSPPHACTPAPGEFALEYELVVSPSPLPAEPLFRTGTPLSIPQALDGFSFYPDRPHMPYLLYFGWRLARSKVPAAPCACGKP